MGGPGCWAASAIFHEPASSGAKPSRWMRRMTTPLAVRIVAGHVDHQAILGRGSRTPILRQGVKVHRVEGLMRRPPGRWRATRLARVRYRSPNPSAIPPAGSSSWHRSRSCPTWWRRAGCRTCHKGSRPAPLRRRRLPLRPSQPVPGGQSRRPGRRGKRYRCEIADGHLMAGLGPELAERAANVTGANNPYLHCQLPTIDFPAGRSTARPPNSATPF